MIVFPPCPHFLCCLLKFLTDNFNFSLPVNFANVISSNHDQLSWDIFSVLSSPSPLWSHFLNSHLTFCGPPPPVFPVVQSVASSQLPACWQSGSVLSSPCQPLTVWCYFSLLIAKIENKNITFNLFVPKTVSMSISLLVNLKMVTADHYSLALFFKGL